MEEEGHAGAFESAEGLVLEAVEWLRLLVEAIGIAVVAFGLAVALWAMVRPLLRRERPDFTVVRLSFARYLALALEFQLAADILSTAIAPSWDQIGKLGAIAVIRTGLNFFLTREIEAEKAELEAKRRGEGGERADVETDLDVGVRPG